MTGLLTGPSGWCPLRPTLEDSLSTFKEFPPRQKAATFSLDQVMEKMKTPVNN